MATPHSDANSNIRPDEDILEDVWAAVWQAGTIRSSEMGSFSITVQQGAVCLSGHMASEANRSRIEACARSVPGVMAVRNDLVADRVLEFEVSQALGRDERTQPYLIRVSSTHGWVRLGGEVPSQEIQQAVEEVAGAVPHVRGVTALPVVAGAGLAPARRAVQPRPGASIYGDNGQVGVVAQVVIDPRNRLVTHVVVRANETLDALGKRGPGDYLVPIEAFNIVNVESLFLARGASSSAAYPLFDPAGYPLAADYWRPPFPYAATDVRWPLKGLEAVENWPRPQRQPEWHLADNTGTGRTTSGA